MAADMVGFSQLMSADEESTLETLKGLALSSADR